MSISFIDVMRQAAKKVWSNKGQSFIAVVLPAIIGIITILFSVLIPGIGPFLILLIMFGMVYMTTKMVLSVTRSGNARFEESLRPFGGILKMGLYLTVVGIIFGLLLSFFVYIFVWDELLLIIDFIISAEISNVDPATLSAELEPMIDDFIVDLRPVIFISYLFNVLYQIKFMLVHYFIADGYGVLESVKKSWNDTKGHTINIILVTVVFIVLSYAFNFISFIMGYLGFIGLIYSLAYLVFLFIFYIAYQYVVPALLYTKITNTEFEAIQKEQQTTEEWYEYNDF